MARSMIPMHSASGENGVCISRCPGAFRAGWQAGVIWWEGDGMAFKAWVVGRAVKCGLHCTYPVPVPYKMIRWEWAFSRSMREAPSRCVDRVQLINGNGCQTDRASGRLLSLSLSSPREGWITGHQWMMLRLTLQGWGEMQALLPVMELLKGVVVCFHPDGGCYVLGARAAG